MSKQLEARQIVNDGKAISTVKLSDRDVLRDMYLRGRCVCECRECIAHDVNRHETDVARAECEADCGMRTGAGASSPPTTSTARRQANLQYTNLRFRQTIHRPCIAKHIKKRKLRKPLRTINPKVKNITKQITTKYLQKFKRFISIQNPDAQRNLLKTDRKRNQLSSFMENHPKRMKKYNLGGTGARLGLVNSINVSNSRKRQEAHANNLTKLIANLFSKLMFHLKPFFVMKRKSQTTKKFNRKKRTCYEPPAVTLNYIYSYQSNSSHTLDGTNKMKWGKQSSVLNAASDISSISNSSIQSFNDQETQVSEHSAVQNPIVNGEPFVTNLSMPNMYSQCMLRRNDLLIQHRNKNGKMVIKKSRRVMFRGHHNRFMTRTYRQNFNKTYHTFLAEIDYTNQPLEPCQNRQGVGIGSTWDVFMDFGGSQDLPKQSGADPGSGTFRCTPSVCGTGGCNSKKCYKRLKKQSRQKENIGQGSRSKPLQRPPGDCVTAACDMNVCYKAPNKQSSGKGDNGVSSTSKRSKFQCPPGLCVTGACNSIVCFKRLNNTAPYGSHVSTQSNKHKLRDQRAREKLYGRKKSNTTSCRKIRKRGEGKGEGLAGNQISLTPSGLPSRQAVRIGSNCSFNVKLYKETPLGARSGQNHQENTTVCRKAGRTRKKKKPKICRSGKCDPSDCYRRQTGTVIETSLPCSSNGSSQVSTQSCRLKGRELRAGRETFCKEKGILSKPRSKPQLNMPNRQSVRIGSKCSFNVEFYKCCPHNALDEQNRGDTSDGRTAKIGKKFQCDPRVSALGNPNECFQKQRIQNTCTDASLTGSSKGSQVSKKSKKLRRETLPCYKDKCVPSMPRSKMPLHIGNRQAVRIGSTCSFNIEFYKCSPQNGLMTSQQDYQSVKSSPNKRKPRGIFECEPGVCIPGKCNPSECFKQFECNPKVCVPGKCDPIDCMQRLRGTPTGTADGSCTGSSISTQSRKFKRGKLRAVDGTLYKEKGVSSVSRNKPTLGTPNRQAVRIGSNCSFNIQFYKAIAPPMMGDQNYPPVDFNNQDDNGKKRGTLKKYECVPEACIPGKCVPVECYNRIKQSQISGQSDSSGGRNSGKKRKTSIKYDCEPGACIPGKCNAKECFQLFKAKRSIDNDGSLTDDSVATASQASKKRKRKSKRPELSARNAKFYTERGASSMPRSKTPLHLQNRQAVRIGSTCSFNMEFYKQIPANKRQHPFQYNIDESRKYPAFPSSSEISGGQSTGATCKCMHELVGDKETPTGKKERSTGKKDRTKQKKQPAGQHDQGDATLQEKSSSLPGRKSKGPKGKETQEQGDATTKSKLSNGTQDKASKRKRTKGKQSQTRVCDQQSETSVDEKVGTGKSNDQCVQGDTDTPVQSNVQSKKIGKASKEKTKCGQGDTRPVQRNVQSKKIGKASKEKTKYDQSDKGFENELGVSIPNKCDPCFDRLRNREEGTSTEGSLSTQSKLTGSTSKTTNVNLDRKVEAKRRKKESSISPVYKNMGSSCIATNKNSQDIPQRIPSLGTPGNKKQAVRIGSSCSFNIQIFKDKPLTPAQVASVRSPCTPPPKLDCASNLKQECSYPTATCPGRFDFHCFWRHLTSGAAKLIGPRCQTSKYASDPKKWSCRMMGQPDFPECAGLLHGSQTSQKCQCPARFTCMDAGANAYGNVRPAVQSCCANAATQSRRCPGLQQLSLNDNSLRTALCKCVAQLNVSRGARNVPYKSIVPGNWPFSPVPGYYDFNRYQVREQAVVIGSGCGFNVNFFKKRK